MPYSRATWAGCIAAAVLVGAGCGGHSSSEVSGTVTLDDTEIEKGSITFLPLDGNGPTKGGSITNGRFSVKDVPLGTAKVVITGTQVRGVKKEADPLNGPTGQEVLNMLPPNYSSMESELRYEVVAGRNEKNFNLKSK